MCDNICGEGIEVVSEIVICSLKTEIIDGILYVIQTTIQCVCFIVLADKFGIR